MRSSVVRLTGGVLWAVCLCVFAALPSRADEGALVGIGGTYRPMRGESTVRLAREFLNVRFSSHLARTVVQFEFGNEGPSQTVTMGFPEQTVYARGRYRHFQAELDGRPLAARPTRWTTDETRTQWTRWWVSRVRFRRGEHHLVRVRYEEPPGSDEAGDTYRYLFWTGRTWKGPIGLLEVRLTLEGYPPWATLTADLPNPTRKGNHFAWRFENWEPDADADLDLAAEPHIIGIDFDKGTPDPPMELDLRHGSLDARLWALAFWTDLTLRWSGRDRTAEVSSKGRTLVLKVGDRQALLLPARTPVALPFAPYLEERRLRVPLRPVCEALGLTVETGTDEMGNWAVTVSDPQKKRHESE